MKVKDLIAQLNKLDPNLEIYCFEDGPVPIKDSGPFDITGVSTEFVGLSRDPDTRKPRMTFEGDVPGSRRHAILGITPDF